MTCPCCSPKMGPDPQAEHERAMAETKRAIEKLGERMELDGQAAELLRRWAELDGSPERFMPEAGAAEAYLGKLIALAKSFRQWAVAGAANREGKNA